MDADRRELTPQDRLLRLAERVRLGLAPLTPEERAEFVRSGNIPQEVREDGK